MTALPMPTTTPVWSAHLDPIDLLELTERASLLTRVDRKYLVPAAELAELGADLPADARILTIDDCREFGYRSVYFDTPDLVAYHLTALRRRRRFKIRTRSYLDTDQHLLEVKTRGPRGTTVKQRLDYGGDGWQLADPERAAAIDSLTLLGPHRPEIDPAALAPVLVSSYRRCTLLLPDSDSRVTIDQSLRWSLPGRSTGRDLGAFAVIETKSTGPVGELDRALWRRGHRPCSLSKFGTGLAGLRTDLPAHRWHFLHRRLEQEARAS